MNRMQLAATSASGSIGSLFDLAVEDKTSGSPEFSHSLFVPLHYEKGYAYPLLVWLHGDGDDQRQLKRVMPGISLRNYVAVAPQGTSSSNVNSDAYCWQQSEADVIEAQWRLTGCIETVQNRYNIHPDRIFIGGYADGGTMALRLALRMPQLCAGVISVGGALPDSHAPLVNVERARGLSVLLMQGEASTDYPSAHLCSDLRLLHAAGISVAVRQYPAEDELTTKMLSDIDAWVMSRVTGEAAHEQQAVCDRRERN
mgnify:CR=1 FL=1